MVNCISHKDDDDGSSPSPATIYLGEDLLVSCEFWELEIVGSTPTTETNRQGNSNIKNASL